MKNLVLTITALAFVLAFGTACSNSAMKAADDGAKSAEKMEKKASAAMAGGDFAKMMADAKAAQKKAASVNGEWRDTGKMMKKAEQAHKDGDAETAMKLLKKAKKQGELGYEQAMSQKDADFPAYMK